MTPSPTPSDPNNSLDIYDPKNPNFINPNDVLAMHPDDTAAKWASTRLDVVQATVLRSVTSQIVNLNSNLQGNYLTAFNNWLLNYTAGRISDPATAPQPPNGYVVGYFVDPTTGKGAVGPYGETPVQWAYPAMGTTPVCVRPPIPAPPAAYVTGLELIGTAEKDAPGWFSAQPGDRTPNGTVAVGSSLDGVSGLFRKVASPFDSGGYFQKIG